MGPSLCIGKMPAIIPCAMPRKRPVTMPLVRGLAGDVQPYEGSFGFSNRTARHDSGHWVSSFRFHLPDTLPESEVVIFAAGAPARSCLSVGWRSCSGTTAFGDG